MQARLLDLFWMAPSVHTHLHKAQCDGEPRYSHTHSWHNISRTGSMFALSSRHISLAGTGADIYRRLRGLFTAPVPAVSTKRRRDEIFFFFCLFFSLAACRRSPIPCPSRRLQPQIGLMRPTWFNPCKYRQQIHNLMIHIMKTGYKLSTSSVQLVLFTSSRAESL